jgi:gas vesicle protein GvpN
VAREDGRQRKIRGARIRASRSEKSTRQHEKELDRLRESTDDVATDVSATEATVPDVGPFVETDAVDGVRHRVDRWLDVGRPVHLVGPTGCGKTALAVAVARERDRPVVFVNGDVELTTADLVGEYAGEERYSVRDKYVHNVQKSKDVVRDRWVDNPLTLAVREGATLVYNEFSRTKPAANNVLLSVFEEGTLELPGKRGDERYVDVHEEFRAVLTSNSAEYAGVHTPQDALLDRLIGVHMDFYDAETERAIVDAHVDLPPALADTVVEVVRDLRERVDVTVGTRSVVMTAEGVAVADDLDHDILATVCTDALSSKVPDREGVRALRETVADVVTEHDLPEAGTDR